MCTFAPHRAGRTSPLFGSNMSSSPIWACSFPDMEIVEARSSSTSRATRKLAIQELETEDLLESIQEAVWRRRFRDAVRLQVEAGMPQKLVDLLTSNLELDQNDVYRVDGPVDIGRVKALLNIDRPALNDKPFMPSTPKGFCRPPQRNFQNDP